MDNALLGTIGGVVGAAIGVMGGVWGTYRSIKSCRTVEARRFMIRAAVVMWCVIGLVGLALSLAMFGILPRWVYWAVMICMLVALMPAIKFLNARLASYEASGTAGGVQT